MYGPSGSARNCMNSPVPKTGGMPLSPRSDMLSGSGDWSRTSIFRFQGPVDFTYSSTPEYFMVARTGYAPVSQPYKDWASTIELTG